MKQLHLCIQNNIVRVCFSSFRLKFAFLLLVRSTAISSLRTLGNLFIVTQFLLIFLFITELQLSATLLLRWRSLLTHHSVLHASLFSHVLFMYAIKALILLLFRPAHCNCNNPNLFYLALGQQWKSGAQTYNTSTKLMPINLAFRHKLFVKWQQHFYFDIRENNSKSI